jgi:hypothetical protein
MVEEEDGLCDWDDHRPSIVPDNAAKPNEGFSSDGK